MKSPLERKLKNLDELSLICDSLRKESKSIVMANGCFDILHVGHVRYLDGAKSMGDVLIVAINSDESARNLKGKGRPLMNERDRAEIIANISVVDYVIIFNEKTLDKILKMLKPDIHCKGKDYTSENVPEKETVLSYGGKVAIAGDEKRHSTTTLIQKLKEENR